MTSVSQTSASSYHSELEPQTVLLVAFFPFFGQKIDSKKGQKLAKEVCIRTPPTGVLVLCSGNSSFGIYSKNTTKAVQRASQGDAPWNFGGQGEEMESRGNDRISINT